MTTRADTWWSCFYFVVDIPDQNSMVYIIENIMEEYMLSEQLVVALKTKTKLIDDQIASITESEGWEIIRDIELLNRKNPGRAKSLQ